VRSLPPNLVFSSVSLFSSSCRLFPRFPETYAHPKLKKMLKTKLKQVIPTFFSCFDQILAASTEGSFLLGWSDPRLTLATESCAKVGAPAQHGAIPRPFCPFCRVQLPLLRRFTRSPWWTRGWRGGWSASFMHASPFRPWPAPRIRRVDHTTFAAC